MLEYWPTVLSFSEESKLAVGQVTETLLIWCCSFPELDNILSSYATYKITILPKYWVLVKNFTESKLAVGQVTETVLTRCCSFLVIYVGL